MIWRLFPLTLILGVSSTLTGIYFDNGMDQTVQEFISLEDQSIMQEEILILLGLSHVPVRGSVGERTRPLLHQTNHTVPLFMLDIYDSITAATSRQDGEIKEEWWSPEDIVRGNRFELTSSDIRSINESDIIMSFANHGRQDEDLQWTQLYWFDTSELPRDPHEEAILSAELRLYKKSSPVHEKSERTAVIKVFQLVEGSTGNTNLLDSLSVNYGEAKWISLDVTKALTSWQKSYKTNQGLMVEILDEKSGEQLHPDVVGLVGNRRSLPDQEGFMVAYLKSTTDPIRRGLTSAHRQKREANPSPKIGEGGGRKKKKNKKGKRKYSYLEDDFAYNTENVYRDFYGGRFRKKGCQKRSLFVSFRDLGWQDWIIAPEGYSAYYCHGECSFPLNTHMNATNHAIVQTLVHLMDPSIPKPCCAPTKLSGISVLYFGESSNVFIKKFRNMVVKSCGCH